MAIIPRSAAVHTTWLSLRDLLQPFAPEEFVVPRKPLVSPAVPSIQSGHFLLQPNGLEGKTAPSKHTKRNSRQERTFNQTWWGFEIAALLLACAAFVARVVVLRQWDKSPQQRWSYRYLTLNGLVAILATITRVALLVSVAATIGQAKWTLFSRGEVRGTGRPLRDLQALDEASRGAWGSLGLLCSSKGVHLSSFGALITILALAFDTFSQQVVGIELRSINDTRTQFSAAFPRSQALHSGQVQSSGDFPLSAGFYNGIYNTEVQALQADCPTGNCTWPTIPSLSMCGGCTNVTTSRERECSNEGIGTTNCSFTLPSGTSLGYDWNSDSGINAGQENMFVSSDFGGQIYDNNAPAMSQGGVSHVPLYAANFEAIHQQYIKTPDITGPTGPVSAVECALWFCIQAYDINTTLSRQSQNISQTWTETWWQKDSNPKTEPIDDFGYEQVYFTDPPSEFNVMPGMKFSIDYRSLSYAWSLLDFNQSIQYSANEEDDEGDMVVASSDIATSMWIGSQNWTLWIATLSTSMTNALRTSYAADNDTDQAYNGQVHSTQYIVQVRWAWLAFPAAMLLASLVSLVASIWQAHRSKTQAWKNDALVLLSVKLDKRIQDGAQDSLDHPGELGRQVGIEKVMLHNNEGCLELRLTG